MHPPRLVLVIKRAHRFLFDLVVDAGFKVSLQTFAVNLILSVVQILVSTLEHP